MDDQHVDVGMWPKVGLVCCQNPGLTPRAILRPVEAFKSEDIRFPENFQTTMSGQECLLSFSQLTRLARFYGRNSD